MANALSALSKRGVRDSDLEARVRQLVLSVPAAGWNTRALALVSNAFGWLSRPAHRHCGQGGTGRVRGKWEVYPRASASVRPETAGGEGQRQSAERGGREMHPHQQAGGAQVSVREVYGRIAQAVTQLAADPATEVKGADISMILNGAVKAAAVIAPRPAAAAYTAARTEADAGGSSGLVQGLLDSLAPRMLEMPLSAFTPQDTSLILNACARSNYRDRTLLLHLSAAARAASADSFSGQAIAVTMSAISKLSFDHVPFLLHLCEVAQQVPTAQLTPHHVGAMMTGMARLGVSHRPLTQLLGAALDNAGASASPMAVANVMYAAASLDSACDTMRAWLVKQILGLEPGAFTAQGACNCVWGIAVLDLLGQPGRAKAGDAETAAAQETAAALVKWSLDAIQLHLPPSIANKASSTRGGAKRVVGAEWRSSGASRQQLQFLRQVEQFLVWLRLRGGVEAGHRLQTAGGWREEARVERLLESVHSLICESSGAGGGLGLGVREAENPTAVSGLQTCVGTLDVCFQLLLSALHSTAPCSSVSPC